MSSFSYIEHIKKGAGKPMKPHWVQKLHKVEGMKYFQTLSIKERTMMLALLAYAPNPFALIVEEISDGYWEAIDVVFKYHIFQQKDRPQDPDGYLAYEYKFPAIKKELPKLKL